MGFLIVNQLPFLTLAALFAGAAGWALHCLRTRPLWADIDAERDQLKRDLLQRSAAALDESERYFDDRAALQSSYDKARELIVELEERLAAASGERDQRQARIVELEQTLARMQAEAGRAAPLEAALTAANARIAELSAHAAEGERLREKLTALGLVVQTLEKRPTAEQLAAAEARAGAAEAQLLARGEPTEEGVALKWRARYLDARVRYLEAQATRVASREPSETPEPVAAPVDAEAENRRRWRQRYLEARLAWLDGRVSARRTAVEGRLSELEAALAEAARTAGLAGEAAQKRIAELEASLSAADAAAASHQTALTAAEAGRSAALRDAEDAAEALRKKLAEHETELDRRAGRIAEAEGALAAVRADVDRHVRKVAEIEGDRVGQAGRIAALEAELAAAQARLAALEAQPATSDVELNRLRWSERYLENRVRFLEALAGGGTPARVAESAAPPEPFKPLAPEGPEARPLGLPAARGGAPDDLRLIDGVQPRIESTLNSIGVFHFDQIAAWTPANVAWVERYLAFNGRVGRERWVEQAKSLAAGLADTRRRYLEGEHV